MQSGIFYLSFNLLFPLFSTLSKACRTIWFPILVRWIDCRWSSSLFSLFKNLVFSYFIWAQYKIALRVFDPQGKSDFGSAQSFSGPHHAKGSTLDHKIPNKLPTTAIYLNKDTRLFLISASFFRPATSTIDSFSQHSAMSIKKFTARIVTDLNHFTLSTFILWSPLFMTHFRIVGR